MWRTAERHLSLGSLRCCLLTCSRRRTFNALSFSFLFGTCNSLKNVNGFNSVAFPSSWMTNSSSRDNREFMKNAWSITHDLSNLQLLQPISNNFVMTACILLLTLTELSLFPFFCFDSCWLSWSRMFNWVVLLVVSNGDSALFSSSIISCLISCCESLIFFGSDGSRTEEDCNPTRSRRASAK